MITVHDINYLTIEECKKLLNLSSNSAMLFNIKRYNYGENFITPGPSDKKYYPETAIQDIIKQRLQLFEDEWDEDGITYVSECRKNELLGGKRYSTNAVGLLTPIILNSPFSVRTHYFRKSEVEDLVQKRERKENDKNIGAFLSPQSPEVAYLLGLWWADGYIPLISSKRYEVHLSLIQDDMLDIEPTLLKIAKGWRFCYEDRTKWNPNAKTQKKATMNSKQLVEFLNQNNYLPHSSLSACKILSLIPERLHYLFFRGLMDGDGCWSLAPDRPEVRVCFTGNKEQDWTFLTTFLKNNDISYQEVRQSKLQENGKTHSNSRIRISKSIDIFKLGELLYPLQSNEGMGLSRKYKQWIEIRKFILQRPRIKTKYVKEFCHI